MKITRLNGTEDSFDGENLDTFLEIPIVVTYNRDSDTFSVSVGLVDITSELDETDLAMLREDYAQACSDYAGDMAADRADWEYEQYKDRMLDEVDQ